MKEYRQLMQLKEMANKAVKYGAIPAALYLALRAGAHGIAKFGLNMAE
jgi:hypothetical protein